MKAKAATASAGTSNDATISDINQRIGKLAVTLKSASINQNNGKSRNGNPGTLRRRMPGYPKTAQITLQINSGDQRYQLWVPSGQDRNLTSLITVADGAIVG